MDKDHKTIRKYVRKNWGTVLLAIILVIILVNPNAKSWTLRQLIRTGLFNARINTADTIAPTVSDFDFTNEKGEIVNTSTLRGKVVFINFWASWCPPCRAEFPSIEKLYEAFKNDPGVYFLLLNEDDNVTLAINYLSKEKYTVPFHQATAAIPAVMYNGTLPTTVILDKKGNIRYKKEGIAGYSSDQFMSQLRELINE